MSLPEVSVCIPVYNGARYLAETLESVCRQDYPALQVVVTVEPSTDASWEIVEQARTRFPGCDLVAVRNPRQLGMAANWNRGLELARGDFVKVMGQDDRLEAGCLEAQARFLQQHPECALVAGACRIVRPDGRLILIRRRFRDGTVLPLVQMMRRCFATSENQIGEPVTVLMRRADFAGQKFNPAFRYYTDADMWFRARAGASVGFLGDALCSFRVHRSACSSGLQSDAWREFLQLEALHPEVAPPLGPLRRALRWLRGQAVILARTTVYRLCG